MLKIQEAGMEQDDGRAAEVQDALDTTDQLHNDISRLKRLKIITPEEDQVAKQHIEQVSEALSDKLPDD